MKTILLTLNNEQLSALNEMLPFYLSTSVQEILPVIIAEAYRNYKLQ